jgi:mutator protein MutT
MNKGIIIHTAIINRGKLLILKRIAGTYLGNRWDLPGGTLEDGEDPAEGAIRETFEETGLKTNALELFFHYSNVDQNKNKQFITLIFLCEIESNPETVLINPEEHDEFEWVELEDIADYPTVDYLPPCAEVLKKIFAAQEKTAV